MNYVAIAWRNIGRNVRRSVLSMIAAGMAALSIIMLFGILGGMSGDLEHNLIGYYTGEVRIRHRDYSANEQLSPIHLAVDRAQARVQTLQDAGVNAVPRLTVAGGVFDESNQNALLITGVDFDLERDYAGIDRRITAGDYAQLVAGATQTTSGPTITPALVGNRVPQELGLALGDTFTVVARAALGRSNAMTFRIAAIADFPVGQQNATAVWIPLERAQRLAMLPGQTGEIVARFPPGTDAQTAVDQVTAAIDTEGLEVSHWSTIDTAYQVIEMANVSYAVMGLIFFALASTVIVNTTMMAIHERRREIGTLAALGFRSGQIVRLFWVEASLLGALGSVAGVALGLIAVWISGTTGIDFSGQLDTSGFEMSNVLYPSIATATVVLIFGFSCLVSSLTSLLPTRRITKLQPVAALREA